MRFTCSKQSINNLYTLNNYASFKKKGIVLLLHRIGHVLSFYRLRMTLFFFKVSLRKFLLGFRQINAFVWNKNFKSMPIHLFEAQKLQNGFEKSLVVRATCVFGENFYNPWNRALNWSLKEQIIWQLIELIRLVPSP